MYWHVTFTKLLFILISVALLNGCALFNSNDGQTVPSNDSPFNDPTTNTGYPPSTDTSTYHTVQPGETLYGIATRYGRNYQEVAAWNNIPPPYILNVGQHLLISAPAGGTVSYPAPSTPSYNPTPVYTPPAPNTGTPMYHTVQQGESLYGISTRYGQNFRDVAAWNNIPPPYTLTIGQSLLVSSSAGGGYQPPATTPVYNPPAYTPPPSNASYHTVSAGDTLYSIAKRYGRTVGEVAAWNNLSPPYTLSVGMRLLVSSGGSASSYSTYSAFSAVGSGYHTVAAGETVYRIAKMYGYTIAQIAAWNGLYPPYTLSVGQRLRVSPNGVEAPTFETPKVQAMAAPVAKMSASLSYHKVQQGESLQVVANKYGVTAHELISWNGIGSPYTIYPQQELLIAPPN